MVYFKTAKNLRWSILIIWDPNEHFREHYGKNGLRRAHTHKYRATSARIKK
jgi:hypothetical protein